MYFAEDHLAAVIDAISDPIFVKNRQHQWVLLNDAYCAFMGYEREVLIGKSDYDFFPKQEADVFWTKDKLVFDTGQGDENEEQFTDAEGKTHTIVTKKTLYTDACGDTFIVGVIRDITERKRVETEFMQLNATLQAQATHLAAINKELSDLTYSISHDLRAPLRGIDGYSQLLMEDYADRLGAEGQLFLRHIRNATQQMGRLIEDLLAYSRLERRTLAIKTVEARGLIERLVDERADDLAVRAIRLETELPAGLTVRADPEVLMIALRNLLDNAVKFSRDSAEPRIEIGGRNDGRCCTLWVRDNGLGFDMKFHDRIFGIFQRLTRPEEYPGTGVGLAIVHKAMQRLGGRVWADSNPGQGAVFYLELAT